METTGATAGAVAHAPEDIPGSPDRDAPSAPMLTTEDRWERKIDTAVVIALAVASLLAAWGGYQAGLWSSVKTTAITEAETKQIEATRATTIGYQEMQIDIAIAMPEYQVPELQEAAVLDAAAHQAFVEAESAGATGDAYVLATLLLAVVLFFAGVCTKIGWRPAQLALLGLAVLLLVYSVQTLGALPDGSEWGLTPIWG